jgi:phosphatidylinositol-4-phosphate 3-kinase
VEHVILHVVCELEGDFCGDVNDYVLKVWGLAEYFTSHTTLSDYEYIHQCIKLERDVELSILQVDQLTRPLARTVSVSAFSHCAFLLVVREVSLDLNLRV